MFFQIYIANKTSLSCLTIVFLFSLDYFKLLFYLYINTKEQKYLKKVRKIVGKKNFC